jgi:two-component system, NtrC family, response regulator
MSSLLIIDDSGVPPEEITRDVVAQGHVLFRSTTIAAAVAYGDTTPVDVAFLGSGCRDASLSEALRLLRGIPSHPEVIVLRTEGTPEEAAQAITGGAWDYIENPASSRLFSLVLSRVLHYRAQRGGVPSVKRAWKFDGIVGGSPQMRACIELAAQAADSDANVLITGETGTGKELIAVAIHANSARANGNFVVVDCAALPENLVDSTLLGHERGAFTGADKAHVGLIKQADGGTLFLDEIGELPLSAQKSFLRVLQERRFRPVGGTAEVVSDFRIVAASNRNLDELTNRGEFRKDLLFRVRAFTVDLSPLRERREDIADLIRYHVPLLCERMGLPAKDVSGDFFEIAERYSWPGNVREVVNALERSIGAARHDSTIFATHLPNYVRIHLAQEAVQHRPESDSPKGNTREESSPQLPSLAQIRSAAMDETERRYLTELLSLTHGDISEACRISQLSRSRLYALLKQYGIHSSLR